LKPRHRSFPPVAGRGARVLILGTLPGVASLAAGRYYAHPRNAFWRLMGDLAGAGPDLLYRRRLARLRAAGLALWDVVAESEREGSADSDIRGVRPTDVPALLRRCPSIRGIVFNGQGAARLYRRHLASAVAAVRPGLQLALAPSTSPAHATMSYAEKRRHWRVALRRAGL
jgi:hypoxanthine-DNA glycosylase